jgi:hypothetical protein
LRQAREPRIVDFRALHAHGQIVKAQPRKRKLATPKDIIRLARKLNWQDVKLPKSEVIEAATIRQMFALAARSVKRRKTQANAAAA